jgi:hypothetical protein
VQGQDRDALGVQINGKVLEGHVEGCLGGAIIIAATLTVVGNGGHLGRNESHHLHSPCPHMGQESLGHLQGGYGVDLEDLCPLLRLQVTKILTAFIAINACIVKQHIKGFGIELPSQRCHAMPIRHRQLMDMKLLSALSKLLQCIGLSRGTTAGMHGPIIGNILSGELETETPVGSSNQNGRHASSFSRVYDTWCRICPWTALFLPNCTYATLHLDIWEEKRE